MEKRLLLILTAAAAGVTLRAAEPPPTYVLGVPGVGVSYISPDAADNEWLAKNSNFVAMSIAATTGGVSRVENLNAAPIELKTAEAGFPIERAKPDYYLADVIAPPENVDWAATFQYYNEQDADYRSNFLFDEISHRIFAVKGGTPKFMWILDGGAQREMTYTISPSCSGRPRRIYWTGYPYNSPSIDLSGKFVKFMGADDLLEIKYGNETNTSAGISVVVSNKVVRGLYLDQSTHMLSAYGEMQGQVVMAYYDTGTFERLLHVQVVEICRPIVNRLSGEIGKPLSPAGRGYDTTGLRAQPTHVTVSDNRGDYYYQHQGNNSYSPKHGNVYPLRPTVECPWNMEVYWMETDEMEVKWPFELDQYECDWPKDAVVFVRGDEASPGRPVYFPSAYTAELMKYQEPEGHARAVATDGTFKTLGEGCSLVKLTADDNVWFVPVHSISRANKDYFTLKGAEIPVGEELRLRGGSLSGTAPGFSPVCDAESPGAIYEGASDKIWNPRIYAEEKPDSTSNANTNVAEVASSSDTNTYASVVYAVRPGTLEVWWNTVVNENDMPKPIAIPTLPQVYDVRWPVDGEVPQIVIASQLGSASRSIYLHNMGAKLDGADAHINLHTRKYFDADGGTVMFWVKLNEDLPGDTVLLTIGDRKVKVGDIDTSGESFVGWRHYAVTFEAGEADTGMLSPVLTGNGCSFGEILFWNRPLTAEEIAAEKFKTHENSANFLTGAYSFIKGEDLVVTGTDVCVFKDKVLRTTCRAHKCIADEAGPPALDSSPLSPDDGTTATVYAQNDPKATGYNPNEEHAILTHGAEGYIAWALRCDLNTGKSSDPGVLVEYVKNGRKTMQWFDVAVTNSVYPLLAADCVAGKAFPGPHPIDLMDNPWCPQDSWDEDVKTAPAFRDRKGQLWARAAGTATMRMWYRMQDGFAFPSIDDQSNWPAVGTPVPWLSLLGGNPLSNPLSAPPAKWKWNVRWPDSVPEMEIGRTLTTASSGLPEVWNAASVGVVWPATAEERDATAILFDPTVARTAGFKTADYPDVATVVAKMGIKQGAGGNAMLRQGKWYFEGLPPTIAERFYLDTTADIGSCLKLIGKQEDNAAGVALLHVNVLSQEERKILSALVDGTATSENRERWRTAIADLAKGTVKPSQHKVVNDTEDFVAYEPRDHYALFTMGATNYVTLIENDSTNAYMSVADGDPINMHILKVVPKYYTGRVVTREDPLNLLSQQLSIIYAEAFAGKPDDYIFEWRMCRPHSDGTVPTDFEDEYEQKFAPTNGLTRFVIGGQGDTLANMVNTYYAMRYRAASEKSPAYAVMGYDWSEWTDPPALAEGWVQRVLNNVTPFSQRMRDLVNNEVETAVSMVRQAGKPYEGDVALNNENLKTVGLVELYETILSKAESMSLALGIDDIDANKQLQLAVARLADLYNVLGDEAWTDALNPTIGFGSNFDTPAMTGFELDYGYTSTSMFCFDNQVPTLLDEEIALLRGRSGENAPSTRISPYYNRLPWNLTKSPSGGEVAYMVNYDISGDNEGIVDENDAAAMYPQGHGDAYGHYLSALSGYYRLLRNPFFSWGKPAMGEMVVADSVVNVDYYDEAQFAKAAYNVAKVAEQVVDRTARKAYRDNGGATGAGYIDSDKQRNFGYGEWASRGGYGALCNWAVANAILPVTPTSGRYYRYCFDGTNSLVNAALDDDDLVKLEDDVNWTLEFQLIPSAQTGEAPSPVFLMNEDAAWVFGLDADNKLYFSAVNVDMTEVTNVVYSFCYTNSEDKVDDDLVSTVSVTNGTDVLTCFFLGRTGVPSDFPDGYDALAQLAVATNDMASVVAPVWDGWGCVPTLDKNIVFDFTYTNSATVANHDLSSVVAVTNNNCIVSCTFKGVSEPPASVFPADFDVDGALERFADGKSVVPPVWEGWECATPEAVITTEDTGEERLIPCRFTDVETKFAIAEGEEGEGEEDDRTLVCTIATNANTLVALRNVDGVQTISVFDAQGALIAATENLHLELKKDRKDFDAKWIFLGMDYAGEIGEFRLWNDAVRSNAELLEKRAFVNPLSEGLALYLRPISDVPSDRLLDDRNDSVVWYVDEGFWLSEHESGMYIDFEDEGLKRIDRSTVAELDSLADTIPAIQRKIDQMDAGLNPLGLASAAIPFDLTPIGEGDDAKTHFEQIRERAVTALKNAHNALDKAQFYSSRLRLLQESHIAQDDYLDAIELEAKNELISYYGYPYEGDIGPGGSYAQGYDGPDLLHYMWMEPETCGLSAKEDVKSVTTNIYKRAVKDFTGGLAGGVVKESNFNNTNGFLTLVFETTASGIVVKPDNIKGKRRAQGQIQDAMSDYLVAYADFKAAMASWDKANYFFQYDVTTVRSKLARDTVSRVLKTAKLAYDQFSTWGEAADKMTINTLTMLSKQNQFLQDMVYRSTPKITGAGMTVNVDPSAIAAAALSPAYIAGFGTTEVALLTAKNALVANDAIATGLEVAVEVFDTANEYVDNFDEYYLRIRDAAEAVNDAADEVRSAFAALQTAQAVVESVAAEAERVISNRTLTRNQASDTLTKARYNEMFFRLALNNTLSRYYAQFELAQKYTYLAAQAYDYETGLLSSDKESGEKFIARIVGARTLGEFDDDGEPLLIADGAKGDGGLASIIAELDANWLVIKPRLGINNPQNYSMWFSMRHDLFRIDDDEKGDKNWKVELRKYVVDDLNKLPEFKHYCQPLAGSSQAAEPGLVIPFSSLIAHGYNFFGQELEGGDSALDPTYFATRIAAAGVHFEGYDDGELSATPKVYLVPVGEDRMRAVGDMDTVLSWKVVDQTIPAPYAIGSTKLDDPDWTPLYEGYTSGNDFGARIRRHPSFLAYYDEKGKDPNDDSLDCSRLVGRSAWNTKWLLIIPAGSMGADRQNALSAFVNGVDSDRDGTLDFPGVTDIKIGLKTYSTSGN